MNLPNDGNCHDTLSKRSLQLIDICFGESHEIPANMTPAEKAFRTILSQTKLKLLCCNQQLLSERMRLYLLNISAIS